MTIAQMQKVADKLDEWNLGYDQGNRWNIKLNGECDCSSSCGYIAKEGGFPVNLKGTFYTGNFAQRMKDSGYFTVLTFKGLSQVKAGDFLLTPGHHVVFARTAKDFFSAEYDERGKSFGGATGDQTGREVRYRTAYMRPGGWKYIVRPISPETFAGQLFKYYAIGNSNKLTTAKNRLVVRAPYDGPLYVSLLGQMRVFDLGMSPVYDGSTMSVPKENHAFVILGGTINQMNHRLESALSAIKTNKTSKIIVTGGKKRGDKSEAEYMRDWLISNEVDASQILLENSASSTIGNANKSVPLMIKNKITSYTLVSHSSHLRRASSLFLAAKVKLELPNNTKIKLDPTNVLAYQDKKAIELPVSPATKLEICKEVAYILGLSSEFAAAK